MRKMYQKKNLDRKTRVRRHFGGFTLIELLVVVLIIGILAAIAVPKYQKAVRRAKAAEYAVWVKRIVDAEQEYFMANGRYTGNIEKLDLDYKNKWPNLTGQTYPNGELSRSSWGDIYLWDFEGYIFRVHVGEPINSQQNNLSKIGGYGAQLHAKRKDMNYPLVCSNIYNNNYCKEVMGINASPLVSGDYNFFLYPLE